jgi:hypothetical protein
LLRAGALFPFVQREPKRAADVLSAYLNTYLKEEVREEGLVCRVPRFVRFLTVAGQINVQAINLQNIARDAAVSRSTAETCVLILMDTRLGHYLPVVANIVHIFSFFRLKRA